MSTEKSGKESRGELRNLVSLALPLVVVNVGYQVMGLIDTALAGRIGALALGATGLGSTIFFLGAAFGMGIVMGVDPVASQAFGAARERHARRWMWHGIYAGLLVVLPIAVTIWGLGQCLELVGVPSDLADETRLYLHARLPSLLPLLVTVGQRTFLQAAHWTWPLVASTLIANVFNFVADWVLVFGDAGLTPLGVPAMGIRAYGVVGIGWATTLAVGVQLIVIALAVRSLAPGHGEEPLRTVERQMLSRIFVLGVPIGLQMLAEMGIFSLVAIMAGTMGSVSMAAHQVALMLAASTFMVPLALGTATSVQVGRAIGRMDVHGTRRSGLSGIGLGAGFMFVSALAMWIFPETLARVMTSDPQVHPIAVGLIRIAGVFQVFDGVQAVSSGALRGAGMTQWAMGANIVAYWFVGFPIAMILGFGYDEGPRGLWWGLTAGLALAAVILTIKFAVISRRPIAALEC
jgi:MATE family multidrug resistance protein